MDVVALSTWFPTDVAPSSGAFVLKDITAIRDAGHDVRLIHLVPPHQDDGTRHVMVDGMKVLRMGMNPTNPIDVARVATKIGPMIAGADILHSMAVSSLPSLALAKMAGSITLPWVHTEHWSGLTNPETLSGFLSLARTGVGNLLRMPDVVTAVCQYLADPIEAARGSRPVRIVPCIVPPVDVVEIPDHGDELRLITVGGLIDRKNPHMCLDIAEKLQSRGYQAHMVFVGDGPMRAELEKRARSLSATVTFTGNKDRDGVLAELAASHVFIGPTKGDNFFVSAAEAITAGRPVVVSNHGGQSEYITPTSGRVLTGGDAAAYADAVVEMIDGADASAIAASIGTSFFPESVGAAYTNVYREAKGLTRA